MPTEKQLRAWYLSLLQRSKDEGTVLHVSNLVDLYFHGGKDHRYVFVSRFRGFLPLSPSPFTCSPVGSRRTPRPSVTDLPYFDGDYWIGEAEEHLKEMEEMANIASGNWRDNTGKKEQAMTTLLPDDASPGEIVLAKLAVGAEYQGMQKMKQNFIVAHLYESCSHCRTYVSGSKLFRHPSPPAKVGRIQLCQKCFARESGKLVSNNPNDSNCPNDSILEPLGLPSDVRLEDLVAEECPIIPATADDDPEMDNNILANRLQYLSLCYGRHYQYDTLRRARYSSTMTLYHLHNPSRPLAFTGSCHVCQVEIHPGKGYRCTVCPSFDMCRNCFGKSQMDRRLAHPHPLTTPSGQDFDETQMRLSPEQQSQKNKQVAELMGLIFHAARCQGCDDSNCIKVRAKYRHMESCPIAQQRTCPTCRQMLIYISYHSKICTTSDCPVPQCSRMLRIRSKHATAYEAARAMSFRKMVNA